MLRTVIKIWKKNVRENKNASSDITKNLTKLYLLSSSKLVQPYVYF